MAEYLLGRIFDPAGGEAHIVLTAAYVMRETGKSIAEVGDEPFIMIFRTDGTADYFYNSEIKRFDEVFKEYDRFVAWSSHYISDAEPTRRHCFTDERMAAYILEVRKHTEKEWREVLQRREQVKEWGRKQGIVQQ